MVGFNPLIFFAVFGSDRYYQCLELALVALHKHGRYRGAILVAADRPRTAVARYVPEGFRKSWIHKQSSHEAGLFARYELPDWELRGFGPFLYMDVDVVVDAPIDPLLHELAVSSKIHVATENRLLPALEGCDANAYAATDFGNWFGTWLCADDARFKNAPFALGSSGIMGFDSTDTATEPFLTVRSLRRIADDKLIAAFTDQALLNYALHCCGAGDFQLLDRYTGFARSFEQGPRKRLGLLHFHSGVGNADAKFQAMSAYLGSLKRKPASSPSRSRSLAR
jgi:hypothetical protein